MCNTLAQDAYLHHLVDRLCSSYFQRRVRSDRGNNIDAFERPRLFYQWWKVRCIEFLHSRAWQLDEIISWEKEEKEKIDLGSSTKFATLRPNSYWYNETCRVFMQWRDITPRFFCGCQLCGDNFHASCWYVGPLCKFGETIYYLLHVAGCCYYRCYYNIYSWSIARRANIHLIGCTYVMLVYVL